VRHDGKGKAPIPPVEEAMSTQKVPKTDSIQKLAEFWDTHDLTDFEAEMVEVTDPVFDRGTSIAVPLEAGEAEALRQIAQAKGISQSELLREWVKKEIDRQRGRKPSPRSPRSPVKQPKTT
jgi:hypothetical protein